MYKDYAFKKIYSLIYNKSIYYTAPSVTALAKRQLWQTQGSHDPHVTMWLYITSCVAACLFFFSSSALDLCLWTIQLYRLYISFLPCLYLNWLSPQHYLKLFLLFFSPKKEFKYIYRYLQTFTDIYGHLQTINRIKTGQNFKK